MKNSSYLVLLLAFGLQACQTEPDVKEIIPPESYLMVKIVDWSYHDLIDTLNSSNIRIKFFYNDSLGEQSLDFTIFYYQISGTIIYVRKIPELSCTGIKNFYLKYKNDPVDTLYLDIKQKSNLYNTSDWFSYLKMQCNGIDLEYNSSKGYFYIKK